MPPPAVRFSPFHFSLVVFVLSTTVLSSEVINVVESGAFPCERLENRSAYHLIVADNVTSVDFMDCFYYSVHIDFSPPERWPNSSQYFHLNINRVSYTSGNFDIVPVDSNGNITNLQVTVTDSRFCGTYRALYVDADKTVQNVAVIAKGRTVIDAGYYAICVSGSNVHNVTLIAGGVVSLKAYSSASSMSSQTALGVSASRADGVNIFVGDRARVYTKSDRLSNAAGLYVTFSARNVHINVGDHAVIRSLTIDRRSSVPLSAASVLLVHDLVQTGGRLENVVIAASGFAFAEAISGRSTLTAAAFSVAGRFRETKNITIVARDSARANAFCRPAECVATAFGMALDHLAEQSFGKNEAELDLADVRILAQTNPGDRIVGDARGGLAAAFAIGIDTMSGVTRSNANISLVNVQLVLSGGGTVSTNTTIGSSIGASAMLGIVVRTHGQLDLVAQNVSILSDVAHFDATALSNYVQVSAWFKSGEAHAVGGLAVRDRYKAPTPSSTMTLRDISASFARRSSSVIRINASHETSIAVGGVAALWSRGHSNALNELTTDATGLNFQVAVDALVNVSITSTPQPNTRLGDFLDTPGAIAVLGAAIHVTTSSSLGGTNGCYTTLTDFTAVVGGTLIGTMHADGYGSRAVLGVASSTNGEEAKSIDSTLNAGVRLAVVPGAKLSLNASTGPSSTLAVGGVAAATNVSRSGSHLKVDWSDAVVELLGEIEVTTLSNGISFGTPPALTLTGMAAEPSSGPGVTIVGNGRKLVACGSDIAMVGVPAASFTVRTTLPMTGGADVFRTSNCPSATIGTFFMPSVVAPFIPDPHPPVPFITTRAVYRDADDACSGPFSDIAGPIVWTRTHTITPGGTPTNSKTRTLTGVPTLSSSLTRSHSDSAADTRTPAGTLSASLSPSRSISAHHSTTTTVGPKQYSTTTTMSASRTVNLTLTLTSLDSDTRSSSLASTATASTGKVSHTVTGGVLQRGAALEGDDGADGGSVGVVAVAALLGLALCAVLVFLVAWRRRKAEADAKEAAFVEVEQQELQTGPLLGTHSVFVDAARQEELLHVRAGRDEVIAAAETIDSDDDDFASLRPREPKGHSGNDPSLPIVASIDSLSDVDSDML